MPDIAAHSSLPDITVSRATNNERYNGLKSKSKSSISESKKTVTEILYMKMQHKIKNNPERITEFSINIGEMKLTKPEITTHKGEVVPAVGSPGLKVKLNSLAKFSAKRK